MAVQEQVGGVGSATHRVRCAIGVAESGAAHPAGLEKLTAHSAVTSPVRADRELCVAGRTLLQAFANSSVSTGVDNVLTPFSNALAGCQDSNLYCDTLLEKNKITILL